MDTTWLRLGDESSALQNVAYVAEDGTIYLGEWEHEKRRPVGRVRPASIDGYTRGPLQELGIVADDGQVLRGGQHGVLVGSVTEGVIHAHAERGRSRQIGIAEGVWAREAGAAALLLPELRSLWEQDRRQGAAAGLLALAVGMLAEPQPPQGAAPDAGEAPPAAAPPRARPVVEGAPARRRVRPPVTGNLKKLGFGKRAYRLGDRVECRRIRYEGVGVVEAISNDMSQGSGGTNLYPTLFVRFEDGAGDWYHPTALTRVSSA